MRFERGYLATAAVLVATWATVVTAANPPAPATRPAASQAVAQSAVASEPTAEQAKQAVLDRVHSDPDLAGEVSLANGWVKLSLVDAGRGFYSSGALTVAPCMKRYTFSDRTPNGMCVWKGDLTLQGGKWVASEPSCTFLDSVPRAN